MEERGGEAIGPCMMIKKQCKQFSKVDNRNLLSLKIEFVALNSISLAKSLILQEKHFVLSQTLLKFFAPFYFQHELYQFMPRQNMPLIPHPTLW